MTSAESRRASSQHPQPDPPKDAKKESQRKPEREGLASPRRGKPRGSDSSSVSPVPRHHRGWAMVAAIASIAALTSSWFLVNLYASPDRPKSPGWLAVYGDNVGNSGGNLAVFPIPVRTFKGTLRLTQD